MEKESVYDDTLLEIFFVFIYPLSPASNSN